MLNYFGIFSNNSSGIGSSDNNTNNDQYFKSLGSSNESESSQFSKNNEIPDCLNDSLNPKEWLNDEINHKSNEEVNNSSEVEFINAEISSQSDNNLHLHEITNDNVMQELPNVYSQNDTDRFIELPKNVISISTTSWESMKRDFHTMKSNYEDLKYDNQIILDELKRLRHELSDLQERFGNLHPRSSTEIQVINNSKKSKADTTNTSIKATSSSLQIQASSIESNNQPKDQGAIQVIQPIQVTTDDITLIQKWMDYVKNNDMLNLTKMLKSIDINCRIKNGPIALMIAIQNGNLSMAKFLLENGADVNFSDYNKVNTLMKACMIGNSEMVQLLLSHEVDMNSQDKYGRTALMKCIEQNKVELVKMLFESGADISIKDNRGQDAIEYATSSNFEDILAILQQKSKKRKERNFILEVPLENILEHKRNRSSRTVSVAPPSSSSSSSSSSSNTEIIQESKPDSQNSSNPSSLNDRTDLPKLNSFEQWTKYVVDGDIKNIKMLIKSYNFNIDCRCEYKHKDEYKKNMTALMIASYKNDYNTTKLLLDAGANPNLKGGFRGTPLMMTSSIKVAELLISKGANLDELNSKGETALIKAIYHQRLDIAKLLIYLGADLSKSFGKGDMDAESYARKLALDDIVEIIVNKKTANYKLSSPSLLQQDIKPSIIKQQSQSSITSNEPSVSKPSDNSKLRSIAKGKNINKLVTESITQNNIALLESVIKSGRYDANTINDKSPLILAINEKNYNALKLLIDHGIDVNIGSPVITAASIGDLASMKLLLSKKPDLDKKDSKSGQTALIKAVINNHVKIVSLLLQTDANMTITDNNGLTALDYANTNEVISLLQDKQSSSSIGTLQITKRNSMSFSRNQDILHQTIGKRSVLPNPVEKDFRSWFDSIRNYNVQEVSRILMTTSIDINVCEQNSFDNALNIACNECNLELIRYLVQNGASINFRNPLMTPLMNASSLGNFELVKCLISLGADVNLRDVKSRKTALLKAIKNNHFHVVQLLIESGADPSIHDSKDRNGFDLVKESKNSKMIRYFEILKKKKS